MPINRRAFIGGATATTVLSTSGVALGQKKYSDGASDTEIKVGHTNPYSGPASAFGVIGKTIQAYWKSVNEAGGINGRKVNFITLDDGYNPAKTVECIRQLVEQDKVLCTFNTLGAPTNTAIHKYMNQKKVPMLFVATGASKWNNPKEFPWTTGFQPDYHTEGVIYAKHILGNVRDPKIGVLMQNDDYGRDYLDGFVEGLGGQVGGGKARGTQHSGGKGTQSSGGRGTQDTGGRIITVLTYEPTDQTVDSQMSQLKESGANVFFNISTPSAAAQAIRRAADIGWKPVHYLSSVSGAVTTMKTAGFSNSEGVITAAYLKEAADKQWADDTEMKAWRAWMDKRMTGANQADPNHIYAYAVSFLMHETLKKCGDELTRENVMRQAANHRGLKVSLLLPGILVNTSPTDFRPIKAAQLQRFKGGSWELFGQVIEGHQAGGG